MEGQTSVSKGSETGFYPVCHPCNRLGKSLEAEGYCQDCCQHLCVQCLRYHTTLSVIQHHVLIDKVNMPQDQDLSYVKEVCTEICKIHPEKVIEFFCPDDGVFGCFSCATKEHSLCNGVVSIQDESSKLTQRVEYESFKDTLDRLFQHAAEIIQSAKENLKISGELYIKAQQDILAFRHEINSTLDQLEEEIKQSVEETKKRNTDKMDEVTIKASEIKDQMKKLSSDSETLLKRRQYCQMFIKMKTNEKHLVEVQDKLEELEAVCISFSEFRPSTDLQQFLSGSEAFGKLLEKDPRKTRAQHVMDINISSKDNKTTCKPRGCELLSDAKLVVTDFSNYSVKIINLAKDEVTVEKTFRHFPWDVSATTKNSMAVTFPCKRQIYFLWYGITFRVYAKVRVNGECFGIAYFKDQLVVTYNNPGKVEILAMNGAVLKKFENDDGRKLFMEPKYVSVYEKDSSIFISDWGNHSLIKVSMDGHFLAVYKDHLLSQPCQSVIDGAGLVYLCGGGSYNIHLLTSECRRIRTLLNTTEEIGSPYTVCYCEESEDLANLYLGTFLNNSIMLYKLTK